MKAFMRIAGCVAAVWGCAVGAQEDYRPAGTGQPTDTVAPTAHADEPRKEPRVEEPSLGLYVLVGGGVEGYAGQLSPRVQTGFTYGATVGYRAMPFLALELGYNGSINNLDENGSLVPQGDLGSGPDLVRNGGQLLALGIAPTERVQPFVLAGIGFDRYTVRHEATGGQAHFQDDTAGYIPVGLGLRIQLTRRLTADVRAAYHFLFDQDFASTSATPNALDGRYMGLLQFGGTY
ncbi:outer membrane protein [Myxococcus landrumensis]|uniref:Porin family protein n=1 Tax=Myxococcus landrumensis TaxID=2813577 RepID=A0ABX7N0I8_9BACT|nr:outer membrane beta-barrel protein [Myxococcus landrumus]QSQ12215.1 porin family protein [Myxococcus landrumus]